MALDAIKEARLDRASFAKVYTSKRMTWLALGKEAYRYAKTYANEPTYDDVAPHLEQALRSNGAFLDQNGKEEAASEVLVPGLRGLCRLQSMG